ncbi:MAG TPA: GIY-YIG nuclease family protein [Candidatus Omnitrophica bacterium]|nr:GIY-YIG nuclease family protein [Candidatus Omnitrophota bacterium]
MYYFYILKASNNTRYYGHTNNLSRRTYEHAKGQVPSTRKKRPLKLIYYEELNTRSETFKREMQFKNGKTRKETIEKLIDNFPKTNVKGLIRPNRFGKQ